MANRIDINKAQAIAAEYLTNGLNATKALLVIGYKKSYATQRAKKVLDNVLVKQAIAKIQAKNSAKTDINLEFIQSEHIRLQKSAEQKGDLACATANLAWLGKTGAHYKDKAIVDTNVVINVIDYKPKPK
jgi:hypothetical protein